MNQNMHFTVYDIDDPGVLWNMPVTRQVKALRADKITHIQPYQDFVDYIVRHGGIIHKVHPESFYDDWVGPVHFITPKHPEQVRELRDITGFAILPEGYEQAGAAGGAWDATLVEYLLGSRDKPVWASGDADYHGPQGTTARATTMFYMREFTEQEVYNCMKEGRMVALTGPAFQDVYVSEFSVSEGGPAEEPIMFGLTGTLSGAPVIRFSLDHQVHGVRTRLIRNGKVIEETGSCRLEYTDHEAYQNNIPCVYRIEVTGSESALFTNPIFVYFRR